MFFRLFGQKASESNLYSNETSLADETNSQAPSTVNELDENDSEMLRPSLDLSSANFSPDAVAHEVEAKESDTNGDPQVKEKNFPDNDNDSDDEKRDSWRKRSGNGIGGIVILRRSGASVRNMSGSSAFSPSSYERRKQERERLAEGTGLILNDDDFAELITTLRVGS